MAMAERGAKALNGLSLKKQLDLEVLSKTEYRAKNLWMASSMRALFGGQVMGQALKAAFLSMSDLNSSFVIQSYHCYFVGPMQPSPDVIYKVEHVKLGNSFCSVVISGIQNSRVGFHCMVSFQRLGSESHDLDYCTREMPEVPLPQEPSAENENSEARHEDQPNSKFRLVQLPKLENRPLDIYMCLQRNPRIPAKPKLSYWIRSNPKNDQYQATDHQSLHRINLAYATDSVIGLTILATFPKFRPKLNTSLDHSVWFYGQIKDGNWYLYCHEVEHSYGGRTLNSSRVYSEDGELIAVCKQEYLFKPKL